MVMYVCVVKPYATWQLSTLEVTAHSLHAMIVIISMAIATSATSGFVAANWAMVIMLVLVVVAVLVYEVWSLVVLLRYAWTQWVLWWQLRRAQPASKSAAEAVDWDEDITPSPLSVDQRPLQATASDLSEKASLRSFSAGLEKAEPKTPQRTLWPSIQRETTEVIIVKCQSVDDVSPSPSAPASPPSIGSIPAGSR